jgi:beta-glucanase (GH16 family)
VGVPGTWSLKLDSSFNAPSLDTSIWRTGWFSSNSSGYSGPINSSETACYTANNVAFPGDGTMHLNVTHAASTCSGVSEPWTGGVVTTNPHDGRSSGGYQYTYGALEARVFVPADGTAISNWPAVWAEGQSWPNDGEDDLMEGLGGAACWHFHDALQLNPGNGIGGCASSITPGWHTFASDWEPGSVTYYYDGVAVGSVTTGITTEPQFIILDNTVQSGYTSTTQAGAMQVQYVRVWQH